MFTPYYSGFLLSVHFVYDRTCVYLLELKKITLIFLQIFYLKLRFSFNSASSFNLQKYFVSYRPRTTFKNIFFTLFNNDLKHFHVIFHILNRYMQILYRSQELMFLGNHQ